MAEPHTQEEAFHKLQPGGSQPPSDLYTSVWTQTSSVLVSTQDLLLAR